MRLQLQMAKHLVRSPVVAEGRFLATLVLTQAETTSGRVRSKLEHKPLPYTFKASHFLV